MQNTPLPRIWFQKLTKDFFNNTVIIFGIKLVIEFQ